MWLPKDWGADEIGQRKESTVGIPHGATTPLGFARLGGTFLESLVNGDPTNSSYLGVYVGGRLFS